jgi:signal transduction histidine kinase
MKLMPGLNPLRRVKFELFGRSLSARVFWLTVGIIVVVEFIITTPSLGRLRDNWLWNHVSAAHLAALSAAAVPNGTLDPATQTILLQLSDTESIKLTEPGRTVVIPERTALPPSTYVTDLSHDSWARSTWRASVLMLGLAPKRVEVRAPSPLQPNAILDITMNAGELADYLRVHAARMAILAVIVGLITGLLVFAVLDRLLVRPMRIMTASIVGFRQDPEQEGKNDLAWLAAQRDDEISLAARELKATQDEMRAALWRNARLAAVGTAVAKISHDLRNILSSALLVADRLQQTSDPIAQRAARTLIPSIERAAQLVSRTVDFAREGPPAITRSTVRVRELVDEAALVIRPEDTGVTIVNLVPASLVLALDRAQIYRVLVNLLRNAAEAGADLITLSVETLDGVTSMKVSDNGPGLPLQVQENLFKPFTGSGRHGGTGLGLAIARDLVRAHGGDLLLAQTSLLGTVFVMELAVSEEQVQ